MWVWGIGLNYVNIDLFFVFLSMWDFRSHLYNKQFFGFMFFELTGMICLIGNPPLVIAHGGFSGIFPDSSSDAYNLALYVSVPNVVLWCNVQLTKDGVGICAADVKLDNATDIGSIFKNGRKTYLLNGVPTKGWFSVDFTFKELAMVSCMFELF